MLLLLPLCVPINVCLLRTSVPPSFSLFHSLVIYFYFTSRSSVEGVTMYSWLVTVLLLASAANGSGGQGAMGGGGGEGEGGSVGLYSFPHRCTSAHHKLHMYTT